MRPKKEEKQTDIHIRMSFDDKKLIESKARQMGYISVSKYIRDRAVNAAVPLPKSDVEAIAQLRRIGTNLNQVTHRLNWSKDEEDIKILQKYIAEVLDKINYQVENITRKY